MDVHFNICKVKYAMLNDLTDPIFKSQPIKTLNIFINLDDLFGRLKNSHVNQEFQACGTLASKQLASNVFNLIAHYRQWGARKNVNTKVYAYYTTAKSGFESRLYVPKYRKHFVDKCNLGNADVFYINQAIQEADPLMKVISTYIDGIYIIDSGIMEPSCVPLFIQSNAHTADWNILITRDEFDLQYCTYDKFSYIYPAGDYTKVITAGNLWNHIANKEKIDSPYIYKYPPDLIVLALAVVGNKRRSIDKVKRIGWRTLFNIIDDLSEKVDDHGTITLEEMFVDKLINEYTTIEAMNNNILATNISNEVKLMDVTVQKHITTQLVDIPDYENLNELNRSPLMFAQCPLNLQFLTDEGHYSSKNPFI